MPFMACKRVRAAVALAMTQISMDCPLVASFTLAEALTADEEAMDAQNAANEADMCREPIHTEACSICGGPCILDPHFDCVIAEAQR